MKVGTFLGARFECFTRLDVAVRKVEATCELLVAFGTLFHARQLQISYYFALLAERLSELEHESLLNLQGHLFVHFIVFLLNGPQRPEEVVDGYANGWVVDRITKGCLIFDVFFWHTETRSDAGHGTGFVIDWWQLAVVKITIELLRSNVVNAIRVFKAARADNHRTLRNFKYFFLLFYLSISILFLL